MASKKTKKDELEVREKQAVEAAKGEPTWSGRFFTPAVDIYSTETAITLVADMPGVDGDSLDIDLREGVLTLVGKVDDVQEGYRILQREYEVGGYMRKFTLSDDIDVDAIDAKLANGVLTLTMPKAKSALPRKIQVQVG